MQHFKNEIPEARNVADNFIQEWRESVTIEIKQGEKVVHQLSLDEASVCKNPCRAIDWVMREFCKFRPNGEMYFAVSDAMPAVRWMHERSSRLPADTV